MVIVWNEALPNRGAYTLRSPAAFERWIFAKPYFDPSLLIMACEDDIPVGFCHVGFGPKSDQTDLDPSIGVISMLALRLSKQKQKIGSQLLRLGEERLRERGASTIFAGGLRPNNPFYFGLYGGSNSPGFLESEPNMAHFFRTHQYEAAHRCLVFQRKLEQSLNLVDTRFATLRRRFEVHMAPRSAIHSWWQECQVGQLEQFEFRLEERVSGLPAARVYYWEMEGYGWRWNTPAAGIMDIQVRSDLRQQGVGKYLIAQLLRYLQDQYFGIVEAHVNEDNESAIRMFRSLGFTHVDTGIAFRKG